MLFAKLKESCSVWSHSERDDRAMVLAQGCNISNKPEREFYRCSAIRTDRLHAVEQKLDASSRRSADQDTGRACVPATGRHGSHYSSAGALPVTSSPSLSADALRGLTRNGSKDVARPPDGCGTTHGRTGTATGRDRTALHSYFAAPVPPLQPPKARCRHCSCREPPSLPGPDRQDTPALDNRIAKTRIPLSSADITGDASGCRRPGVIPRAAIRPVHQRARTMKTKYCPARHCFSPES